MLDDIKSLANRYLLRRRQSVPFALLFKKFKGILDRNNAILELMAGMGDKLGGEYVFDRQYIVSATEALSDQVFKLITDLSVLTDHGYMELFSVFERLQRELREELAGRHVFPPTPPALSLEELGNGRSEEAGGKMSELAVVRNILELPVPDGFVITTKSFQDFMNHNGLPEAVHQGLAAWDGKDDEAFEALCADIRGRIMQGEIPRPISRYVASMLDILAQKNPVSPLRLAVRSSAWNEGGPFSFAGQYESVINVAPGDVMQAYRRVVAGAYSPQAWRYRLDRGFPESETAMAVGCQVLRPVDAAGAMYTYSPTDPGGSAIYISSAWGLGGPVVDGSAVTDTFVLKRSAPFGLLAADVGLKTRRLVPSDKGGTVFEQVPEYLRTEPSLRPDQLRRLAQVGLAIERYHRRPQDVEWMFDTSGELYVLQTRQLNPARDPEAQCPALDCESLGLETVFAGQGIVVQGGVGSGPVYVVHDDEDLADFPRGAILVSHYTSPRYSRVMNRAQGIITDVGAAAGHMSTIAREYRVPCVVNTGIATSVLRDGQKITLDATQNAVYRGMVEELNRFELLDEEVFEESVEYRLLRRLLNRITPLNLVDPGDSSFRASNCRTYHDITRFVHEHAVERLVTLAEREKRDRQAKRLDMDLPLDMMLIDVEDGLNARPGAGSVKVGQVRSLPLKALVQGLTMPGMWDTTPVGVDLSSFMSSFTRTFCPVAADPTQAGRNLAVISREYVNMSLHLGYHFTTLDAYVDETINDNYIYFRFFGGVTGLDRRSRRARFIAEILEREDFRVEVRSDLVGARVKKLSLPRMTGKLRVLGALIAYTRQLDLRLVSEEALRRHADEFTQRLKPLTEVHGG